MGAFSGFSFDDPFGVKARDKANSNNLRRYQTSIGLWDQLIAQQPQAYAGAQGYFQKALGSINKGYGLARQNLAGAGQTAKLEAQARGAQNIAGAQQSLVSRGLYNSTAFDAAQRGIHADTSRALASVDENIAGLLANLQIGKGQAQAGAYGALGQLQQQQFGSLANLYQGKIGTISSVDEQATNGGWLNQFIDSIGGIAKIGGGLGMGG